VSMDKSPVATQVESRQKFEKDSKVLARTIEHKIDSMATEQVRVQAIKESNRNDRHQQLEAEREREVAALAAEQAKLQLIADERNQRALLTSRLELDAKINAKEKVERERKAAARATELARVQAIDDRRQQLEAEKEREMAAIAAEQAKQQSITNERNQRALLTSRLELDARLKAEKKADREREAAAAAAAVFRATEQARVQAIIARNQQIEAEREREMAAIAAEQAKQQSITNERNQRALLTSRLELDARLKAEKKADREREQAKLQLIAKERNQRAILTFRLALDAQLNAKKKEWRESKAAEAAATVARAAEQARLQAISDRHQQLEAKGKREAAAIAAEQAKRQLIANERNQRAILSFRLELEVKLSVENRAKKEREVAAAVDRATEQVRMQAINERRQQLEAKREREIAAIAAEKAKIQLIANERSQRAILIFRLELDFKLRALETERKEAAELAKKLIEQEAKARSIRIEEAVKVSKVLNAELERKQRNLLEARLRLEAAGKAERKRKEKAIANEKAEREREAITIADEHAKQKSKAIDAQKQIQNARKQPKSEEEEKVLADYYGSMGDEERAFRILSDLGMIDITPNPEGPEYEDYLSSI